MKEKIFVNFTNHPSEFWDEKQLAAAAEYGRAVDLVFPVVQPELDEDEIEELAASCVKRITDLEPDAVLCQGEFNLCFNVVSKLKDKGITVLAATSRREVTIKGDEKISRFCFVRFRKY